MLPQIERFLKQSIVDKDPHVASSALVSGIHLMKSSPDLVCARRERIWETGEGNVMEEADLHSLVLTIL